MSRATPRFIQLSAYLFTLSISFLVEVGGSGCENGEHHGTDQGVRLDVGFIRVSFIFAVAG